MNSELVVFGIKSVVRFSRVTTDALEQVARDSEAIFPELKRPDFNKLGYVAGFFDQPENRHFVAGGDALYGDYWEGTVPKRDAVSVDALFTAAVKITAERGNDIDQWLAPAGAIFVKQWDAKAGPVSPWARVMLTAGRIVLEYVSVKPDVLGGNGNGEKLIAAYAAHLSALLPDDGQFGAKEGFGQRLGGLFLRAGLSTLSEHPQWVVSETHLAELLSATVAPLVQVMPQDVTGQLKWHDVTEAIMGPAASAALRTMAKYQTEFLGSDCAPDKATGAVVRALFLEAAERGLREQFTRDGLLGLYDAALGVAVQRPELFVGDGGKAGEQLARSVFSRCMTVLKDSPPPFDGELGVALAAAAVEAVGTNVHRFAAPSDPWEQVAADMVQSLTTTLGEALETNGKLDSVFSRRQLIELARLMLTRIAETPRMVLGGDNDVWEGVTAAVATAMKADDKLLLSGDDWLRIVGVAMEEATANPGRLFKGGGDSAAKATAGKLLAAILQAAGKTLASPDLRPGSVLFGTTLREAMVDALHTSAGNPDGALKNLNKISELVSQLNAFVARNAQRYGSKEWLRLFHALLSGALEGRDAPVLDANEADRLLQGAIG